MWEKQILETVGCAEKKSLVSILGCVETVLLKIRMCQIRHTDICNVAALLMHMQYVDNMT